MLASRLGSLTTVLTWLRSRACAAPPQPSPATKALGLPPRPPGQLRWVHSPRFSLGCGRVHVQGCRDGHFVLECEGALQPRQANTILAITRNFLTTASNLPWQHDTALSVLPVQCSSTSCRASGFRLPTFQANVETLFESFVNSLPLFRTQDCLRVRILELSRAQKNLNAYSRLPASRRSRLPGSTHFGTFKGPKYLNVYSRLPPPSQRPRLPGSTHFGIFKGPKYLNVYSRLPPASQRSR